MPDEKSRLDKFKRLRALLTENDVENIDGVVYLNRAGWAKIASYFDISYEIKHSERQEVNGKIIWRYLVRVSSQQEGLFAEAEGIASSDESFSQDKSEYFLSNLAQTRAFNRAISYFVGVGDLSAEEVEGVIIRKKKIQPSETLELPRDEVIQAWEKAEKKLESEIGFYSQVIKPSQPEPAKKLDSITRKEIFLQIGELMNKLGFKTPDEKKKYVSKIVGREIINSASLQDDELMKILKILKEEVSRKIM